MNNGDMFMEHFHEIVMECEWDMFTEFLGEI